MLKKLVNLIQVNLEKIFCSLIFINNFYWLYLSIFSAQFNQDEFQHTHIAWNQSQGLLIYRDFFEHHGPFYAFLNSFIFSMLENPASFNTLKILRLSSLFYLLLISFMVFIIAKKLFKNNPTIPYIATFIFSLWLPVHYHGIQIRPDIIQTLVSLVAFYLLLKALESNREILYISSGLAFGITLMFNFKIIILISAVFLAILIHSIQKKNIEYLKNTIPLFLSITLVFLLTSFWFFTQNSLNEFIDQSIFYNFKLFGNSSGTGGALGYLRSFFFKQETLLTTLTLLGCSILPLRSLENKLLLLAAILPSYGTYKGMWLHFTLMYLPFCSIIAAHAYTEIKGYFIRDQTPKLKIGLLYIFLLLLLFNNKNILFDNPYHPDYHSQKKIIQWTLKNIDRNEIVAATGYLKCPAFMFNRDSQHMWVEVKPHQIAGLGKIKYIAAEPWIIKDFNNNRLSYLNNNYKQLKVNNKATCLLIKEED